MKSIRTYLVVGGVLIFVVAGWAISRTISESDQTTTTQETKETFSQLLEEDRLECNVIGIDLYGVLLTYIPQQNEYSEDYVPDIIASKYITYYLEKASLASDIDAVIIDVNSPGGMPTAGEEIAIMIARMEKPVVAVIRNSGLSAAYWAISSADKIFASKNSDVGSIGVTASYIENVGTNEKDGNKFVELTVGEYKDVGNPNRPLTDAERVLWLNDLKTIYQNFVEDVAINRHIPIEKVQTFANGWSVLGEQALEQGLIDVIGGLDEADEYLRQTIGEEPKVCWY